MIFISSPNDILFKAHFFIYIYTMMPSSLFMQDLTVTVVSELPSYEVELIEDETDHHVVNRQSFVDEQEWYLYMHTECSRKDIVIDQADNSVRRSALSVKCRAARRPGYFVWNIFMVTVRVYNSYILAMFEK